MKIVTLIENLVNDRELVAEHRLSLFIDTGEQKILFDTGQSDLFIRNAQKLGISINEIDSLVLSHGHYDHTGGLYPFLKINTKAKVFAKKKIFIPKYSEERHFIGTLFNEELLDNRLVYVDSVMEIAKNFFLMPDITIHNIIDTHFERFTRKVSEEYLPDNFDDELFMVIKHSKKISIVTACSHRGITNICKTATGHFKLPVSLILGGFHMKDSNVEQCVDITHYFRLLHPKSIGVCHCTGLEKYADYKYGLDTNVFYNHTGYSFNI